MYTDASCEPQNPPLLPKVVLCYLLADQWDKIGSRMQVSQEVLLAMREKQTYIAHGEALAVVFCFTAEAARLRGTSILGMIDNIGVLSALCKGSSSTPDISCIIHAALLMMAALRITGWFEYVPSKANVADGGTRDRTQEAQDLGFAFKEAAAWDWPLHTESAGPKVWLKWFHDHCDAQPNRAG